MAKVFGITRLELKPGVTAEELEKFWKEEMPSYALASEHTFHLLKGIRGEREGQYTFMYEVESIERYNRNFTTDGQQSEEDKQFDDAHPENQKLKDKFETLVSEIGLTDYVELD